MLLNALPVVGRKENDEILSALQMIIQNEAGKVTQAIFPADTTPAGGVLTESIDYTLADANDIRNYFGENTCRRLSIAITGTAAGATLNGEATPVIVQFDDGISSLVIEATGTGTVILTATDIDSSGITVTDIFTVTFS